MMDLRLAKRAIRFAKRHRTSPPIFTMSDELNFLPSLTGSLQSRLLKSHGGNGRGRPSAPRPSLAISILRLAWRIWGGGGWRAGDELGRQLLAAEQRRYPTGIDGLGESASVIGAVNCVVRRGDQLIGENTDGKGFLKSLEEIADPAGKRIVMFGAGGAARAIGVEVALAGATHITIVNRSEAGERVGGVAQRQDLCGGGF